MEPPHGVERVPWGARMEGAEEQKRLQRRSISRRAMPTSRHEMARRWAGLKTQRTTYHVRIRQPSPP